MASFPFAGDAVTRYFSIPRFLPIVLLLAAVACPQVFGQASESAADHFPSTTAIYVHVEKPAELIDTIENHPVVKKALALKQVEDLIASPQVAMALLGRAFVETQIGQTVQEALKENTEKGLWFGIDTESEGVILVFQAREEDRLKKVAGILLKLVQQNAEGEGKDPPFKRVDYRDAVAAKFDDFLVARYKNWFAITNKPKPDLAICSRANARILASVAVGGSAMNNGTPSSCLLANNSFFLMSSSAVPCRIREASTSAIPQSVLPISSCRRISSDTNNAGRFRSAL